MKRLLLAAVVLAFNAQHALAATYVGFFNDLGFVGTENSDDLPGRVTTISGSFEFEANFNDTREIFRSFFLNFTNFSLDGGVVASVGDFLSVRGGTPFDRDLGFRTESITFRAPETSFIADGTLEFRFLPSELNALADLTPGEVAEIQPISGLERVFRFGGGFFEREFDGNGTFSFALANTLEEPAPVPLPASGLMLVAALASVVGAKRRKALAKS